MQAGEQECHRHILRPATVLGHIEWEDQDLLGRRRQQLVASSCYHLAFVHPQSVLSRFEPLAVESECSAPSR
jgi:hypothetical protein